MENRFHVVVAPLNWGLGHATRCIPIIQELMKRHCKVTLASDGEAMHLLRQEFPTLGFIELPSYNPKYSSTRWTFLRVLIQLPKFLRTIWKEKALIKKLSSAQHVDLIISDNRYGCRSSKVKSVLITHQLTFQVPTYLAWAKGLINFFNRRLIRMFSQCWVPDESGVESLSGDLSMSTGVRPIYIGPVSRFVFNNGIDYDFDFLGIVSGPEPQRTIFEELLRNEFIKSGKRCVLVKGRPDETKKVRRTKIDEFSHLGSKELNELILRSEKVVSRSGYSTIMDLHRLGKKAIFIPTPGQTEQEYLAKRFHEKGIAFAMSQNEFDLEIAMKASSEYSGFISSQNNLLTNELDRIIPKNGNK